MADHSIAASDRAKHDFALTASTVDTVTFTGTDVGTLQIQSDGTAAVYYTLDGSTPTVGGGNCFRIPAAVSVDEVQPQTGSATVVKLISSGTPTLSIVRL
jgi:hypothetical protein